MAKKDKFAGMADMFEQHTNEKIRALEAAKARIESDIHALEQGIESEYDNGLGAIEDRNELNALNHELRDINAQIADLQSKQK